MNAEAPSLLPSFQITFILVKEEHAPIGQQKRYS